ncbi:MAG: TonB-dependent receptor [Flavobacteriaceae bacterium]|nr:TonB-dependent receptor [Flavobacteriaceae bacterium]
MKKKYFLIWLISSVVFSQEETTFSFTFHKTGIVTILTDLENKFNLKFSYVDEVLNEKKISLDLKNTSLNLILEAIELKTNLKFKKINKRYYIVKKIKKKITTIQQLDNVIIGTYLTKGISKNKNTSFTITPEKLHILAGLTEADVLESIQQLPGVFSPNETATGLVIRGGTTDQNRVIWDGMNIYHNGHLFGMISAFNPNITKKIIVYNKGTNPSYGERISSVIDINTSHNVATKLNVGLGVNGISTDAFVTVPIVTDKLSVQASIRRSYADIYESFTFNRLSDKVFQNTKIEDAENTNNDFLFLDFNTKVNYKFDNQNHFTLSTLFIDNSLDYVIKDNSNNESFNDILHIKSEGYSFGWDKKYNDNISHKVTAAISKYRLNYNFTTQTNDNLTTNFEKNNVVFDSGISIDTQIKTNKGDQLQIGYQFNLKDTSYRFVQTEDFVFTLDADKTVIRTHSLYTNYNYINPKLVTINLGFRFNYYSDLDKLRFEPRLVINKKFLKNFTIQLTGEIKNQIISQIDETVLSDLSLENRLWRLADGDTFPIINSNQVSLGLLYNKNGWNFDVDYYRKKVTGLTTLSLGFLNPDGTSFLDGSRKISGIDFYVKKKLHKFNIWTSYSFIDIKNKFDGLNNGKYFTASNEIKHAITASIAYKINKFQWALSWRWRNGKPFTKAIIQNDDTVVFEGINTENLEDYHRLDFSSTYSFKISKPNNINAKIGFSIRNLYHQKNQLSREYTGNNSLNDPIKFVDKFSLGFTPNVLFRVNF